MALELPTPSLFKKKKESEVIQTGKEEIYSYPASAFLSQLDANYKKEIEKITLTGSVSDDLFLPIVLPNDATITGAVVYGNDVASNDDWALFKITHAGVATNIFGSGSAIGIGYEVENLKETINNQTYFYCIRVNQTYAALLPAWILYGARIKYQTKNI
jgi:hypothetical protein